MPFRGAKGNEPTRRRAFHIQEVPKVVGTDCPIGTKPGGLPPILLASAPLHPEGRAGLGRIDSGRRDRRVLTLQSSGPGVKAEILVPLGAMRERNDTPNQGENRPAALRPFANDGLHRMRPGPEVGQ